MSLRIDRREFVCRASIASATAFAAQKAPLNFARWFNGDRIGRDQLEKGTYWSNFGDHKKALQCCLLKRELHCQIPDFWKAKLERLANQSVALLKGWEQQVLRIRKQPTEGLSRMGHVNWEAMVLQAIGHHEEALTVSDDALRAFPGELAENRAVTLNNIGKSYFCLGKAGEALKYNSRAFELVLPIWNEPSSHVTLLHYRILFLCALDRHAEARQAVLQFRYKCGFHRDEHLYALGKMSLILSS